MTEAEKWTVDTGQLLVECETLLGRELTAYLAGTDSPREVARILDLTDPLAQPARHRLESARAVVRVFSEHDAPRARAWLRDLNPRLGRRAPATILRCSGQDPDRRDEVCRHAELAAAGLG
jgi:hypothetical protein